MVAMQMAGAGMALSSAYMQTKENKENGAGLFKGGGGGGGLAGAMSTGLRSAGDFMANLASGAWDSTKDKAGQVKEAIQSNSVGGGVSANIDAERAENKATWAAAAAEKENANKGGDAAGGGGGGASDGSDGGNSAGGSSLSAAGDKAGGGEQTGDTFDWGGSVSGGKADAAKDEWQAAIDNYDPKKIGLPDS